MNQKDKFWEYFDDEQREYVSLIMDAEGDYYEKSAEYINADISGQGIVLDIGNGGIINYDYENLKQLICADISISKRIEEVYKDVPNITFIETDIMGMDKLQDSMFDTVIVQKVIHHLAEASYRKTRRNTIQALKECLRVLKKSGSLIICESTVKRWFECLEIICYPLMMKCCDLVKFDRVYQYSAKSLRRLIEDELSGIATVDVVKDIGTGEHVLFLGRKIPSWVLPCGVTYYLIRKK